MFFSRRILLQVTIPSVLVGLAFLAACLVGVWSIDRLQTNREALLTRNIHSLQAAQEMEVRLRQLRLHSLLYVMDSSPARRAVVEADNHQFQEAYERARASAHLPKERALLDKIDASYQRYRMALEHAPGRAPFNSSAVGDLLRWADAHPVQHLLDACEELVRFNRETRAELALESQSVSNQGRTALILAGVLGPVGGLIGGFGVAWGLSRSITRLSVRVRDIHAELDQEVGRVHLAGGDFAPLDSRLELILQRVRDVVARIQEQQQEVLRAEQLAAVGQLAASIAHEVRNPLTSVKLLVGAALRSGPGRALTKDDLQVIHDEVSRLERKVQTLLDFARPPEAVRRPGDLREVVHRSLELVGARIHQQGVQTDLDLPESPVCVDLDTDQFTGVLVNLFLNALDAMSHGGRLEVTLRADADKSCQLRVADTGPGIAASVAGRLFTPFASTKPTGTGLGLSICRRVVSDHRGTLTGENRLEGGACFTITLPLHLESKEVSHAEAAGR